MAWARLDDGMLDNPKILAVDGCAFALHVAAILFCARNLTDGHLPAGKVPVLLNFRGQFDTTDLVHQLTAARLWEEVPDGYRIHDFLQYNPSRAQVLSGRARDRQRKDPDVSRRNPRGFQTDSRRIPDAPVSRSPSSLTDLEQGNGNGDPGGPRPLRAALKSLLATAKTDGEA